MAGRAMTLRRSRVANKRNSRVNVPLDWLDWSNWREDRGERAIYLHVEGAKDHPEDQAYRMSECVYRVFPRPRADERVRLSMIKGELYWIYDR